MTEHLPNVQGPGFTLLQRENKAKVGMGGVRDATERKNVIKVYYTIMCKTVKE